MIVLRLLLMLQAGLVVFLEARNEIPELSISTDKSFKLRVFISHVKKNAPERYRYLIDESYSSEQKRTIIKYKTLTSNHDEWFKKDQVPYQGTVIVDGHTKSPLVVFANFVNEQWCKELDWWKFEQLCHIEVLKSLSNNRQLLDDQSNRIHGPSNILFWFERVHDRLEPVKATHGVTVRDVPSDMFKHPFTGPESAQTYTYYAKSQIGKGGKGMPLRITIDFPEGSFVQYDFISPAEVSNEPTQSSGADYFANDLILDEFFIPRASGCSQAGNHSDVTLSNTIRRHDSFSFEARAKAFQRGRDMMLRVAYHKELNLMRADRQTIGGGSNMLVDFNQGRTFRSQVKSRDSQGLVAQKSRFLQPHEIVSSQCIMSASPKRIEYKFNMETVLLGSQGSWRYLGLARLRGLQVRAYEAYDTQWPLWLQPPVLFWNQDNEERVLTANTYEGEKLSTVVYVLNDNVNEKLAEGTSRLVGMEIFLIRDSNREVLMSRSISIFGFDWQVNHLAGWSSLSAIFSMADQCAASLEHNEHLQVSMSVVRADNPLVDDGLKASLLINKNRDLSLLRSIQNDLGIPGPMLYDLRSEATYQKEVTNLMPMSMTFRLAKSKQPLVKMRLYGTGVIKANLRPELITLQASLRDCYNLVAHRKVENCFFGYSPKISLCVLDYSEDSAISVGEQQFRPRAFDMSKEGTYDIYLVQHTNEETELDMIARLRDLSRRSALSDSQLMKKLFLPDPSQTMIEISFIIQSFKIFDTTEGSKQFGTTEPGKLFNLGLVPDKNLVNLLETEQESSDLNHHKAADFAACQMACLLDTNCATFSYCLRGSQTECVLTSVDFNDANLIFQLIDHFKERPTGGRVEGREFSLKVDTDKEVRVRQRAACELRTKSYLDLYRKSNREIKFNLENVIIEPALGGREGCARRCFMENERVLKKMSSFNGKIYPYLEEIIANQDQVAADAVGSVQNDRLQTGSELCKGFFYMSAINLNFLPDNALAHFEKAIKDLGKELGDTGFCFTRKPLDQRKPTANGKDPEETVLDFEEFYFKFETIYEKQPGLRLLEGMKTKKQLEVLRQLSDKGEVPESPDDIGLLKDIITRRENTQNTLSSSRADETVCAEACTLQTLGPWPACRSFDVITLPRGVNGTNKFCKFNSISYADAVEAKRTDLIDFKDTHIKIQTHYEPKFNIDGLARWRSSISHETQAKPLTWATSIILVLGSITGLVSGVIFVMKSSIVRDSEEALIGNTQHSNNDNVENSFNLASLHLAS